MPPRGEAVGTAAQGVTGCSLAKCRARMTDMDDRVACCDGACGARLRAGAWRYACGSECDYEICVSCEVEEAREGVTVIAAGVKRDRPVAPPRGGRGRSERRDGEWRGETEGGGGACDGQGGEAEGPRRQKARRHIL